MGMSDYVQRLRARLGHELLLLPSALVVPRDQRGKILLVKHSYNDQWGLIGGSIELDEAPEAAARREAAEEIGVSLEHLRILGAVGGPEFRVDYPNGDQVAYVSVVYEATLGPEQPRPDGEETIDARWFEIDELLTLDLNSFARVVFAVLGLKARSDRPSAPGVEP